MVECLRFLRILEQHSPETTLGYCANDRQIQPNLNTLVALITVGWERSRLDADRRKSEESVIRLKNWTGSAPDRRRSTAVVVIDVKVDALDRAPYCQIEGPDSEVCPINRCIDGLSLEQKWNQYISSSIDQRKANDVAHGPRANRRRGHRRRLGRNWNRLLLRGYRNDNGCAGRIVGGTFCWC